MEKLKNNHFVVEIDGIRSPAVQSISGLGEGEMGAIERVDAGTNRAHKLGSGVVKWPELVLKRDMAGDSTDTEWRDWFVQMFDISGGSEANPAGYGIGSKSRKRAISIVKRNYGVDVMRFVVYGPWVSKSEFDDLTSDGDGLWQQTITIQHDGIEPVYYE